MCRALYDALVRPESLSRIRCIGFEVLHCCHQVHSSASNTCLCLLNMLCCRCQVEELRKELRNARVRSESLTGVAKDKNAKIRALEEQLALTVTNVKVGWLDAVVWQLAHTVESTLLFSPTSWQRMFQQVRFCMPLVQQDTTCPLAADSRYC